MKKEFQHAITPPCDMLSVLEVLEDVFKQEHVNLTLVELTCSKLLIYLRQYEYQFLDLIHAYLLEDLIRDEDLVMSLRIIHACYNLILKKTKQDIVLAVLKHSDLLGELNDRLCFYYRKINANCFYDFNNIKVIQVSEHHQAVEFVYRNIPDNIGTIVSFDAHIDTNGFKNDKKFYRSLLGKKKMDLDSLNKLNDHLYHDCGAVLPPMIAPYKTNQGIFWILPNWFSDTDRKLDVFLCFDDKEGCYFYVTKSEDADVLFQKEPCENDTRIDFRLTQAKRIIEHSDEISDNYILNIDLDYFVCYGCTVSTSFLKSDIISHYRTEVDFKKAFKCNKYSNEKYIELQTEINIILNRIEEVIIQVKHLKFQGKTPKLIIICDSTRIDFSLLPSHWSPVYENLSMEFTPKYLTFWLRETLFQKLKEALCD